MTKISAVGINTVSYICNGIEIIGLNGVLPRERGREEVERERKGEREKEKEEEKREREGWRSESKGGEVSREREATT